MLVLLPPWTLGLHTPPSPSPDLWLFFCPPTEALLHNNQGEWECLRQHKWWLMACRAVNGTFNSCELGKRFVEDEWSRWCLQTSQTEISFWRSLLCWDMINKWRESDSEYLGRRYSSHIHITIHVLWWIWKIKFSRRIAFQFSYASLTATSRW